MPGPVEHLNSMCPSRLAVHHPAYAKLLKYATGCCPVETGHNWSVDEVTAAVEHGAHESVLMPKALVHFAQ